MSAKLLKLVVKIEPEVTWLRCLRRGRTGQLQNEDNEESEGPTGAVIERLFGNAVMSVPMAVEIR